MPIEDIQLRKAPKGWRPTSDQMQRVQADPRLQRLSQDELYFFFNQPRREGTQQPARRSDPVQRRPAKSDSGVFGWIDTVRQALGGK